MDEILIKANIALFNDEYGEIQRLIEPYIAPERLQEMDIETRALVMWLDAHQHLTYDERRTKLEQLLDVVPPDTPYARSTAYFMEAEAELEHQLEDETDEAPWWRDLKLLGVPVWSMIVLLIVGGALMMLILSLGNFASFNWPFGGGDTTAVMSDDTPTATVTPVVPVPATIRDIASLVGTADYAYGRLVPLQDIPRFDLAYNSGRPSAVDPLTGAYFYAIQLRFECTRGICYTPPHANVLLSAALPDETSGIGLEPTGLTIAPDAPMMESIAEFNPTAGWFVYEVPVNRTPIALLIQPDRVAGETQPEQVIDLSALQRRTTAPDG